MNLRNFSLIEPATHRPYAAALLLWLAECLTLSSLLAVQLQYEGPSFLESAEGHRALIEFLRSSLISPGVLLPSLMVLIPRIAVPACVLFMAVFAVMPGATLLFGNFGVHTLLPLGSAVLCGAAFFSARRSRRTNAHALPPPHEL